MVKESSVTYILQNGIKNPPQNTVIIKNATDEENLLLGESAKGIVFPKISTFTRSKGIEWPSDCREFIQKRYGSGKKVDFKTITRKYGNTLEEKPVF